ncbi:hypothetical protein CKAN_01373500 [Cinnamomum micranthum f. kanehirae]|uniref:Uncharacterized protein n=1 Tax=Cinnamomum micranthum f. kanehirae TaxID=337451 RepID=A0A3S3NR83_9MAGN|nr:hypothetical protein CKAN_01373500 [Cinnamomum micranthum f. kanehirae]
MQSRDAKLQKASSSFEIVSCKDGPPISQVDKPRWTSLFKQTDDNIRSLSFFEHPIPGELNAKINQVDVKDSIAQWKNSLAGYFVRKQPHRITSFADDHNISNNNKTIRKKEEKKNYGLVPQQKDEQILLVARGIGPVAPNMMGKLISVIHFAFGNMRERPHTSTGNSKPMRKNQFIFEYRPRSANIRRGPTTPQMMDAL